MRGEDITPKFLESIDALNKKFENNFRQNRFKELKKQCEILEGCERLTLLAESFGYIKIANVLKAQVKKMKGEDIIQKSIDANYQKVMNELKEDGMMNFYGKTWKPTKEQLNEYPDCRAVIKQDEDGTLRNYLKGKGWYVHLQPTSKRYAVLKQKEIGNE